MAKRDSYLLRIDPQLLCQLRHWAEDDLRSLNAQIEFLLRRELRRAGRLPKDLSLAQGESECGADALDGVEGNKDRPSRTAPSPSSDG